jgi:hypothetical protein
VWVGPCGVRHGLFDIVVHVIDVRLNLVAQRSSSCSLGRDRCDILPDAPHRYRTKQVGKKVKEHFTGGIRAVTGTAGCCAQAARETVSRRSRLIQAASTTSSAGLMPSAT